MTLAAIAVGTAIAQPRPSANGARKGTSAPAKAAPKTDYAQRFAAECSACHGANGRSDVPGVPVLAGQQSLYVITQLFLFREGRRDYAPMVALAKQMSDDDLRGFSDMIGKLPAVPLPASATASADPAKMKAGLALARQHRCTFCHGEDLAGGQQVPRIGGQKEEYLKATLHGFKSGQRPAYTRAMTEALSQVPEADLDVIAYYVANAGAAATTERK